MFVDVIVLAAIITYVLFFCHDDRFNFSNPWYKNFTDGDYIKSGISYPTFFLKYYLQDVINPF